jgi:hypothetical protein
VGSANDLGGDAAAGGYYYAKDGRPLDLASWAELLQDREYARIAAQRLDVDGVEVRVSTVWIGLDHSWQPGTRHTYETMVFCEAQDEAQWRWCSEEHARAGHARVVGWLLRECDEPGECRGHVAP